MPQTIRPATPADIPQIVALLQRDAEARHAVDPVLWALAEDGPAQIEAALRFALTAETQPFQQFWLMAEAEGRLSGVLHAMRLPVPPIYAGRHGDPGLILPDSAVSMEAPEGTIEALIAAGEEALRAAGTRILLSSFVTGDGWRLAFAAQGYTPLTLYLSRSGLTTRPVAEGIRPATEADVPAIVALSAENRRILQAIETFWERHPEADARFSGWMRRSLTLPDRDMLVSDAGYAIAQPASRLHFPPAHDIGRIGVLDDYFHRDLDGAEASPAATALLAAAETAFARRGIEAAFVVCPAGWTSKIEMLEAAGYRVAMVWSIKR